MRNPFTPHHFRFALAFGTRMTPGGLAAAVHAILPFLFITTASRTLEELNAMRDRSARRVVSD
ncbi:MAG: DUF6356 family protein [Pseudomonadota bacterium]|nr:DUF6356 family protein [Pseudomonadota bacterium]